MTPLRRPGPILALLGVVLATAGGSWWLSRPQPRVNVLVITLDTIRTDRLPAYGGRGVRTPAIDSLAARGVLFERAVSVAPLTLPSHTSIFSGLYPLTHGVRDNGSGVVPEDIPLLAELARQSGYRTAAFVGAFVLDSRWGLDRGFETYFDEFDLHQGELVSLGDIRRPGNEVVDRALAWLEEAGDQPFFMWAHLYDPHAPYEPPSPYREQYAGQPYLGAVAFSDAQVGRLLRALDDAGLREHTAVVFVGDHGESFEDNGETGHGFFVYEPTLRVPLIIDHPAARRGSRRSELVSLVDLFPTICGWADIPIPGDPPGRRLVPLVEGREGWRDEPVYGESLYARLHFGWSDLVVYQDERYKLIESSRPELFNLVEDPHESRNLAEVEPTRLTSMQRQLRALTRALGRAAPGERPALDADAQARLASLGYVTGTALPAPGEDGRLPAPVEKIGVYNDLNRSREIAATGDLGAAAVMLERVLASDPGVIDAWSSLGALRLKQHRTSAAIDAYQEGIKRKPDEILLVMGLANAFIRAGRAERARQTLLDARPLLPSEPRITYLLGTLEAKRGDQDEARKYFELTLRLHPKSAAALAELAALGVARGELDAAIDYADRALALDPRIGSAHLSRGRVFEQRGEIAEAVQEYERELSQSPEHPHPGAARALASLAGKLGDADREQALRQVLAAAPAYVPAYLHLAKFHLDRQTRYEEAIVLTEKALTLGPKGRDLALAYFLLADLYNRIGDQQRSAAFARQGERAAAAGKGQAR